MPSRNRSSRICTCVRFLRIAAEDACAAAHQEWERRSTPSKADDRPDEDLLTRSTRSSKDHLQQVGVEQAIPWQAGEDPTSRAHVHRAWEHLLDSGHRRQVGLDTSAKGAVGSVPSRAEARKENTAGVGGKLGWRQPLSRDLSGPSCQTSCGEDHGDGFHGHLVEAKTDLFVPSRLRLHLARWIDSVRLAGGTRETILIAPTKDSGRTRTWGLQRRRSWKLEDLDLEDIAQQMLDLQMNLQSEVQERTGRASSNLTADSLIVCRP